MINKMQNDSNERTNTNDPDTESGGNDGLTSSAEVGSTSAHREPVEETPTDSGTLNTESEADREEVFTALGDLGWNFSYVWNKALENATQREYEPRERIWATELGKAPVDVYLLMKGEKPTNPPNARSLRKFEAGNMFEWIVGLILKRAGIIESAQERVEYQYPGLCLVSGRIDFIAGGKPDFEKAKAEIEAFELPEMFYRGFEQIVEHLKAKYPNGLASKPLEIKSVSSFMFEAIERSGKALANHRLQLTHYLKAKDMNVGHLIYICRDDMRMIEIPVVMNERTEAEYKAAIALRSGYFLHDEMPPLEKAINWDTDFKKFTKNNMGMAYSGYLTKLYGIKDQAEFDAKYQPMQIRFNRTLKRLATGAKITPKNEEALAEMRGMGFDPEALAKLMPVDAPDEEEVIAE